MWIDIIFNLLGFVLIALAVAAFVDWLRDRLNRIDAKLDRIIDREVL
jgi:hypothetical protein